ncbi:MAG TPA: hypothetical protein VMU51_32070 [Mycobacteriales bacterium]|nr:hypothetical protein [Mycobacteriales bacterium]
MRIGLLGAGRIGGLHPTTPPHPPDVTDLVAGDADPPGRAGLMAGMR